MLRRRNGNDGRMREWEERRMDLMLLLEMEKMVESQALRMIMLRQRRRECL